MPETVTTHSTRLSHQLKDNQPTTTNEKMGWIGREEGIAAQAVVVLNERSTLKKA